MAEGTVYKAKNEIPSIDCCLVTITTNVGETNERTFGFDTSNKVAVEPQIEEVDAVKLIIKGVLRAQKRKQSVLTGTKITLTDNVFNPELVLALQGGTITYSSGNPNVAIAYTPPAVDATTGKGEEFQLKLYSAQYNTAGKIVNYECITYPHCTGEPCAFGAEDGTFRAPEYTINSMPGPGEAPYAINYYDELPTLTSPTSAS